MIDRVGLVCFCFPLETYHILLSSITRDYTSRQNLNNIVLGTSCPDRKYMERRLKK